MGEVRATSFDLEEVETSFREAVQVGQVASPEAPIQFPSGPMSTILIMTSERVERLWK